MRRLLGLTASAGVAGLLLSRFLGRGVLPPVQAAGTLTIDSPNSGSGTTSLSSPGNPALTATNTSSGAALQGSSTAGTGVYGTTTTGTGVQGLASGSSGTAVSGFAASPSAIPIAAQGSSGQTANLQEWRGSSGTALSVVSASGRLGIGTATPTAALHVVDAIPIFRFAGTTLPSNQWHFGRFQFANLFTIAETAVGDWLTVQGGTGNVGVGVLFAGFKLDVAGACHATSFPVSSDMRFKEDITPIPDALERLAHIRGVTFEWNRLYGSLGRATPGRQIGLIAQEVEQAFPELVTEWAQDGVSDYRGVDYGRFTAVLVEAIKQLHKQNDELHEHVKQIREANAELRDEVRELKSRAAS